MCLKKRDVCRSVCAVDFTRASRLVVEEKTIESGICEFTGKNRMPGAAPSGIHPYRAIDRINLHFRLPSFFGFLTLAIQRVPGTTLLSKICGCWGWASLGATAASQALRASSVNTNEISRFLISLTSRRPRTSRKSDLRLKSRTRISSKMTCERVSCKQRSVVKMQFCRDDHRNQTHSETGGSALNRPASSQFS